MFSSIWKATQRKRRCVCVYVWRRGVWLLDISPWSKPVVLQILHLCFLFLHLNPFPSSPWFPLPLSFPLLLKLMHTKLCLHCRCLPGNHMNLHGTAGLLCKCPSVYLPPSFTPLLPYTPSWGIIWRKNFKQGAPAIKYHVWGSPGEDRGNEYFVMSFFFSYSCTYTWNIRLGVTPAIAVRQNTHNYWKVYRNKSMSSNFYENCL